MGFFRNLFVSKYQLIDILNKRLNIYEELSEKFIKHLGRHDSHIESIEREIKHLYRMNKELSEWRDKYIEISKNIENPERIFLNRKETQSKGISNTKAIIQALEISGKTLHYKEIFDIIKNYDLKRSHVTLDTIRGASYQLVKRKKIKNGKKPGTFYFKEQKNS
ncbi:MAG: hypothetical protein QN834_08345 [Nitrososphaeraceae archaeon]|nr:hypothetical protein [Nitrososphaeraceae archaeon]